MTPPLSARSPWPLVTVLALGAFTTSTNTTVLGPLLDPIGADLGIPTALAGQLATTTALFAGVTALLAAPVLDRRPRGFWIRLECLLLVAGTLLSALAPALPWLFAGRALAGVGGAFIYGVCMAAVADLFPEPRRRNLAVGVVGTAATLGAVAGLPAVTWLEGVFGWRWALAMPAVLAAVLFAGSLALPRAAAAGAAASGWLAGYRGLLANPEGARVQGANLALSAAWFGAMLYLGSYARGAFGFGAGALALLYLAAGAGEVAGNLLVPLALRRVGAAAAGAALALAMAAALAVTGLAGVGWMLFPLVALSGLTGAGLYAVVSIRLLEAEPARRGAAMAVFTAGFEAGGAAGTAAAGVALALSGGFGPAYGLLALAPLAVAALLAPRRDSTVAPAALPVSASTSAPAD